MAPELSGQVELPRISPAILRRLEWRVQRGVESTLAGNYRSTFRGRGIEFDQVIKYTWGDDLREIDWNVTARLGETYRKRFIEEREITLLVVFADSLGLQFGSTGRTRRDVLLELAALLMLLGVANRDRVGLLYTSPEGFWFQRPRSGREAIFRNAAALLSEKPPSLLGSRELEIPWRLALRAAAPHSILLWLGDFIPAEIPPDWPLLRRKFQVFGFRADDPWDDALPDVAPFSAFDPLTGQVMTLHPQSSREQTAHAAWKAEREDYFAGLFPHARSRLTLPTGKEPFSALLDFFAQHQGRVG